MAWTVAAIVVCSYGIARCSVLVNRYRMPLASWVILQRWATLKSAIPMAWKGHSLGLLVSSCDVGDPVPGNVAPYPR